MLEVVVVRAEQIPVVDVEVAVGLVRQERVSRILRRIAVRGRVAGRTEEVQMRTQVGVGRTVRPGVRRGRIRTRIERAYRVVQRGERRWKRWICGI